MSDDLLADRLKKARLDAGYTTARSAADALGIGYPTYAAHENGIRGFRADAAKRYAKKFKVDATWLLYGESKSTYSESLLQNPPTPTNQPNMDMSHVYVRAIVQRLMNIQIKKQHMITADMFWWVLASVHQALIDEFGAETATQEQIDPLLKQYIDDMADKAGW